MEANTEYSQTPLNVVDSQPETTPEESRVTIGNNKNISLSLLVFLVLTLFVAFLFYFSEYPLIYLTSFLANSMSGGTSFMGFPVAIIQAINIVSLFTNYVIFPFLIFLNILVYKKLANKFSLDKINISLKLFLSILIISFAFWYKPLVKRIEVANAPTKAEMTSQNADMSDWKLYENSKFGFSLKYPDYLKIQERNLEKDVHIMLLPPGKEDPVFKIEIPHNFHPIKAYEYNLMSSRDLIEEKDILIDGINGKLIVTGYLYAEDITRVNYSRAIISNDETYEFEGISKDLDYPDNAIFDRIVSTIKFSRKGVNGFEEYPDTKDWIVYRNSVSNYIVSHPPDWVIEDIKRAPSYKTKEISYTIFEDENDFMYDLKIKVLPLSEITNTDDSGFDENCIDYRQNELLLKSGKVINYSKCQYYNKYILQFPEADLLFVVYSQKGVINPPVVDLFLSSITLE